LALKDHLRIQRTLQATVKAGSEIIEKEQNKVATIKRSETRLQVQ
ncbi:myosin light chain 3, related protein, partial [Toxoplasma gondii p89]